MTPDEYEAAIFAHHPSLDPVRDHEVASRLARLYYLIAQIDVTQAGAFDLDLFGKLSALAIRHEEALGIAAKHVPSPADDKPKRIRR